MIEKRFQFILTLTVILVLLIIILTSCIEVNHSGEIDLNHDLDIDHRIYGNIDVEAVHEITSEYAIDVAHGVEEKSQTIISDSKTY